MNVKVENNHTPQIRMQKIGDGLDDSYEEYGGQPRQLL